MVESTNPTFTEETSNFKARTLEEQEHINSVINTIIPLQRVFESSESPPTSVTIDSLREMAALISKSLTSPSPPLPVSLESGLGSVLHSSLQENLIEEDGN